MTNENTGILVVDDEFSVRDSLCSWFRKEAFRVGAAENATDALRCLQQEQWDLVLVDIKMPGMDGLELQKRIKQINPAIVIIIITAYASVETAVEALKEGAFDYITKPIDPDQLQRVVRNAVEQHRLRTENIRLREKVEGLDRVEEIVGDTPQMREVRKLLNSVAQTDTTVLIRGESGTGKKLVAQAIHAASNRRYFAIVPVSCGAVTEDRLEDELFGQERDVVEGAQYGRKGRLEMADGGTLFLDEVDAISLNTQADLLRILDAKEFTGASGSKRVRVDFRLICATHEDLEKLVRKGQFREDFYYRINVVAIDLPPLRDRRPDIPLLARHFLRKYALQTNKNVTDIHPDAIDTLMGYDWPGNVRELANAMERATVVCKERLIQSADLPVRLGGPQAAAGADSLGEVEKAHIAVILERTGWNTPRAAEILGVDTATLREKIEKYGLRK